MDGPATAAVARARPVTMAARRVELVLVLALVQGASAGARSSAWRPDVVIGAVARAREADEANRFVIAIVPIIPPAPRSGARSDDDGHRCWRARLACIVGGELGL